MIRIWKNGLIWEKVIVIDILEDLVEEWFKLYKIWVNLYNILNRVRSYFDNYIIFKFGDYKLDKIEFVDI